MCRHRANDLPQARNGFAAQGARLVHSDVWAGSHREEDNLLTKTSDKSNFREATPRRLLYPCSLNPAKESETMITKMSHALIWVKDQQEALEFYRDKLGFEVDTDATVGEDFRWLTMRIKTQPGFEIILMEPKAGMMLDEESAAQLRSLVDKGVLGGGVFEADDIYKTYDE